MGKKQKTNAKKIMTQSSSASKVMSSKPQSNISMVPFATASMTKPYFEVRQRVGDGVIIRGRDAVMAVTSAASNAYANVLNVMVSPSTLGGGTSRLARFADLYERYRFRSLRFHHASTSSANSTGSFVMSYDRDASDPTPPMTFQGLQEYLGHQDSTVYNVWQSPTLVCSLGSCPQDGYYTNVTVGDERLALQGQLYIANASTTTNGTYGLLWVEYEVELWQPQLSSVGATSSCAGGVPSNNDVLASALAQVGSSVAPTVRSVGGASRTGYVLPPGSWEFIISAVNAAVGSYPVVLSVDKMGTQGVATLTNLASANSTGANAQQLSRCRIDTTDPEGAFVYGSVPSGGQPHASASGIINMVRSLIL